MLVSLFLPQKVHVDSALLQIDLTQQRVVHREEIERFAKEHGFIDFKEISVKENRNLTEGLK